MLNWLRNWWARRRVDSAIRQLDREIDRRGGRVSIDVIPGELKLTSLFPDNVRTGAVVLRDAAGNETRTEVSYQSSIWEATVTCPFWGGEVMVTIMPSSSRPTPNQLAALRHIYQRSVSIRGAIESAILAFLSENPPHDVQIRSIQDLRKQLQYIPKLQVPDADAELDGRTFQLCFPVPWYDHDLFVQISDWAVKEVGYI